MSISPGLTAFRLSFEICPVVLTGGIATNLTGGALPIISITEALNFTAGLLTGGNDLTNLDDFFAHFVPLPNSTLIDQQIGHYPFANQSVAANAVIPQPLTISLRMICPARGPGGYALKLATITALQATLKQHNISGGTYIVATPSAFYPNCVMLDLKDTSAGFDVQAQNTYQWDFEAPLLTLQDAQAAQNNLLSQITAGAPINGLPAWSGLNPTVGNSASLGSVGTIPAASNPAGSSISSPTFGAGPGPQQ
jgi:hypothetical protein